MSASKILVPYTSGRGKQSDRRGIAHNPSTISTPRSHAERPHIRTYEMVYGAQARPTQPSERGGRFADHRPGFATASFATSQKSSNRSFEGSEVSRGRSRHRMPDSASVFEKHQAGMRRPIEEEAYDEEDDDIAPEDSISIVSSRRSARTTRSKHGSVLGSESVFGRNTEPYYIRSRQEWVQVKRVRPAWI